MPLRETSTSAKNAASCASTDRDLKRTAKQPGRICDYTYAELKEFDVGEWKAAKYKGERIPTIEEVIDVNSAGQEVLYRVEKRPGNCRSVGEDSGGEEGPHQAGSRSSSSASTKMRASSAKSACRTSSAIGSSARKLKRSPKPGAPKIVPTPESVIQTVKKLGVDGVGLGVNTTRFGFITKGLHDAGIEFHLWTVDDPELAKYFLQYKPFD